MQAVRAIFISDVHLGTRACQAESLLAFLREHESEYLYLLGDIIDFWAMSRSVQWAGAHNTVEQAGVANCGTRSGRCRASSMRTWPRIFSRSRRG